MSESIDKLREILNTGEVAYQMTPEIEAALDAVEKEMAGLWADRGRMEYLSEQHIGIFGSLRELLDAMAVLGELDRQKVPLYRDSRAVSP